MMLSSTWQVKREPIFPESWVMERKIRSVNSWRMKVVGIFEELWSSMFSLLFSFFG